MMTKYDIAVCIPTKNEEKNIANVLMSVDKGLRKYFSENKCIIVNYDSNSLDLTRKIFVSTPTLTHKLSFIEKIEFTSGKGSNILEFFKFCESKSVKVAVTVDADLKSITPEWLKELISPILLNLTDIVVPLYSISLHTSLR